MNHRHLLIVSFMSVAALAAAIGISMSRSEGESGLQSGPLAPGFNSEIENVNRVRITLAGNNTVATLVRDETGWGLLEKGGYPVDIAKLRNLMTNIAAAQRVEAKTANPERHAQLSVEDVSAPDAQGVRVDLEAPSKTFSFVFGDNLVRGVGTYVRPTDDAQSWLISSNIAIEKSPASWLQKDIIDVGANRIQSIEVTPVKGPSFKLVRTSDNAVSDFAFAELPKGRSVAEGYQREALAGVLSNLSFDDVFTQDEKPRPDHVQTTRFELDDGQQLTLVSWQENSRGYMMISNALDKEAAQAWIARPIASIDEENASPAISPPSLDSLEAKVAEFQARHEGWVYQLPAFKNGNLAKSFEDYLAPKS